VVETGNEEDNWAGKSGGEVVALVGKVGVSER